MRYFLAPVLALLMVVVAPATNVGDITISAVNEQVKTDRMHFTGTHPRFFGIGSAAAQKKRNARMYEWEQEALARAKSAAVTLQTDDWSEQRKVEGIFGYEVKRNGGGVVSLLFSDYLYAGGANGTDVKTGLTFLSDTGVVLALPELFQNSENGLKRVNEEMKRQLKERGLESQLLTGNTRVEAKHPFYLTNSSLIIVCQESTWFPHAMGTIEFEIPFTQLQGCLIDVLIA